MSGARFPVIGTTAALAAVAAIGSHNGYDDLNIRGNCWVTPGGRIHFIDILGDRHTFLRVARDLKEMMQYAGEEVAIPAVSAGHDPEGGEGKR